VKLLSALALWCGFANLLPFFVAMSIVGGIVAMAILWARQSGVPRWLAAHGWTIPALAIDQKRSCVPYALAIAGGFIFIGLRGGLFS
jgi:prepilin peptidase CpaA